jgi:hypothetical protein
MTTTMLQDGARTLRILVILLVVAGCAARQPGDPLEPGFNVYAPEDDVQIGRQAAAEIEGQVEIVDDDALQDYVSELGRTLAAHPDAGPYPYRFTLINDPAINAFALPGGPIYIHSGLVDAATNEAQLAGVMAHEISHVALRHGTSQASKGNLIQLPAVLAGAAIGQESVVAELGQLGLGLGVNSLLLRYSRSAENEADALGARLMASAGYDPVEMAVFFETLEGEEGGRPPEFLSSHPNPGNRIEAVRAEVQTFPPSEYGASTGRFPDMQRMVAQLPEPPEPTGEATAAVAPAAPSGEMVALQHSAFRLSYPGEWRAYGDQRSLTVTIAPGNGLVEDGRGRVALGYGTVLGFAPSTGTLGQDTQALLSELRIVNPAMQAQGGSRQVLIGGQPALLTEVSGASPYGGAERNTIVTAQRPEGLFYAVFVAPAAAFEQASPVFQAMYDSIRF